jgi:hypothetical protein
MRNLMVAHAGSKPLAPAGMRRGRSIIAPGGRFDVKGLALGNHKFQCCTHPLKAASSQ